MTFHIYIRRLHSAAAFAAMFVACVFAVARAAQPGSVAHPAEPDVPLKEICASRKISYPLRAPRFVVSKSERKIQVYDGDKLVKTYPVALGTNPEGSKEKSGDGKTPEGKYYLIKHASSGFGKCFYIAYPNADDARRGFAAGMISKAERDAIMRAARLKTYPPSGTALGGLILLHGTKDRSAGELTGSDWTLGCVAMENAHILDLLPAIADGARPEIVILK